MKKNKIAKIIGLSGGVLSIGVIPIVAMSSQVKQARHDFESFSLFSQTNAYKELGFREWKNAPIDFYKNKAIPKPIISVKTNTLGLKEHGTVIYKEMAAGYGQHQKYNGYWEGAIEDIVVTPEININSIATPFIVYGNETDFRNKPIISMINDSTKIHTAGNKSVNIGNLQEMTLKLKSNFSEFNTLGEKITIDIAPNLNFMPTVHHPNGHNHYSVFNGSIPSYHKPCHGHSNTVQGGNGVSGRPDWVFQAAETPITEMSSKNISDFEEWINISTIKLEDGTTKDNLGNSIEGLNFKYLIAIDESKSYVTQNERAAVFKWNENYENAISAHSYNNMIANTYFKDNVVFKGHPELKQIVADGIVAGKIKPANAATISFGYDYANVTNPSFGGFIGDKIQATNDADLKTKKDALKKEMAALPTMEWKIDAIKYGINTASPYLYFQMENFKNTLKSRNTIINVKYNVDGNAVEQNQKIELQQLIRANEGTDTGDSIIKPTRQQEIKLTIPAGEKSNKIHITKASLDTTAKDSDWLFNQNVAVGIVGDTNNPNTITTNLIHTENGEIKNNGIVALQNEKYAVENLVYFKEMDDKAVADFNNELKTKILTTEPERIQAKIASPSMMTNKELRDAKNWLIKNKYIGMKDTLDNKLSLDSKNRIEMDSIVLKGVDIFSGLDISLKVNDGISRATPKKVNGRVVSQKAAIVKNVSDITMNNANLVTDKIIDEEIIKSKVLDEMIKYETKSSKSLSQITSELDKKSFKNSLNGMLVEPNNNDGWTVKMSFKQLSQNTFLSNSKEGIISNGVNSQNDVVVLNIGLKQGIFPPVGGEGGVIPSSKSKEDNTGLIVGIVFGVVSIIGAAIAVMIAKVRKQKKLLKD